MLALLCQHCCESVALPVQLGAAQLCQCCHSSVDVQVFLYLRFCASNHDAVSTAPRSKQLRQTSVATAATTKYNKVATSRQLRQGSCAKTVAPRPLCESSSAKAAAQRQLCQGSCAKVRMLRPRRSTIAATPMPLRHSHELLPFLCHAAAIVQWPWHSSRCGENGIVEVAQWRLGSSSDGSLGTTAHLPNLGAAVFTKLPWRS